MLQVSYREEASRLGGIGSCGRELCCSTWLTDYKVVSMGAPKTQNLSINMLKLSGQCGRLKCCLNYELELYHEALNEFPNDKIKLKTEAGLASLRKIDILKGTAWYCYDKSYDWIPLDLKRVKFIIAENKKGKTPTMLSDVAKGAEIVHKTFEYKDDLLGDTDLTRMDKKPRNKGNRNQKGRGNNSNNRNQKGRGNNSNNRNRENRPQQNNPRNSNRPQQNKPKGNNSKEGNPNQENKEGQQNPNPNRTENKKTNNRNNRYRKDKPNDSNPKKD